MLRTQNKQIYDLWYACVVFAVYIKYFPVSTKYLILLSTESAVSVNQKKIKPFFLSL